MRAIVLMFDSLNRHMLSPYADTFVDAPNFARLARRATTFDNFYAGSMPCMPARRELHTGRYNFLHRSWGPLEPFDESMPELLRQAGVYTHLASDHPHYWEDGGATYHTRYSTWEFFRGQEGDPWKGVVDADPMTGAMRRQDEVNRSYMPTLAEHSQTRTVDAGLHFIEVNREADRWMLQLELFDPHEPFFTRGDARSRYPGAGQPANDWPPYQKVDQAPDQVELARYDYAALVSMCDDSLGRVLDTMDEYAMWGDTMLIVNTDHGFLLGEHGWWAKSVQPWFNELVHLPMFMWDPRTGGRDDRRGALAQTIDIAPTLLGFFGIEPPTSMQGSDLALVLDDDAPVRDGALFGVHGGHVNVTDGRYVYMRAPVDADNAPLEEFTLMPTHMRSRFGVDELGDWEPAAPFAFTHGLRTMRIETKGTWLNPWLHGTMLFDLETDPGQEQPLIDDDIELRMLRLLARLMRESDAPLSQFTRLGIPPNRDPDVDSLLVRTQWERALRMLEPLDHGDLPAEGTTAAPVLELLADHRARSAVERIAPWLTRSEQVSISPALTLRDLARWGAISRYELEEIYAALAD